MIPSFFTKHPNISTVILAILLTIVLILPEPIFIALIGVCTLLAIARFIVYTFSEL